jgi:hypothetical protein
MAGLARRHGVRLASLEQQIRDTASGLASVQP